MSEMDNAVTFQQQSEPPVVSLVDIAIVISDFIRRHIRLIYICTIVGLALGNLYMGITSPTYTASATLVLDMRNVQFSQQKPMVSDNSLDSAFVESQVEIVKSKAVELAVIQKLGLTEKPEFTKSTGGILGDIFQSIAKKLGVQEPLSDFERTERALRTIQGRLMARRIGLSFIIEIGFRSADPDLAASVANAVIEAYLDDQKDARVQAARRATEWLQESIRGLREQATAADRAVVEFKTKNNIINTGGKLINEQQVSELSTQLVTAVAQKAEAKARLERIESILNNDQGDSKVDPAVTDSLKSEIITKLRTQYLDLANREAEWTTRYGANHTATIGLRDQMREMKASMLAELARIAETYKSDYRIAEQREANVSEQLLSAIAESKGTNNAQVTMRELESTSQTYRTLYDQFLTRHLETLQQQSFPLTEGRVLSRASKPLRVSWPRASVVYGMSLVIGALLGLLWAMLRDMRIALGAGRKAAAERAASA